AWPLDNLASLHKCNSMLRRTMFNPILPSVAVYETDFQLKLQGSKGILHPSEDLIRLVVRGSIAAAVPGESALDFGVGDGRHVGYLMSRGYRVTGTDVAPSAVEVTKRLFQDQNQYRGILLDNSPELPFMDQEFSLVIAWEVLHWLGSRDIFLSGMRELR